MSSNDGPHYSNVAKTNNDASPYEEYDLRGVRCPMNWVRAKVRLEEMPRGAVLCLWLDDPKGAADLPRAAEAEGYAVLAVEHHPKANEWRVWIEK